ncbi:MAG TPA: hypothetical protein VGF69_06730 [Thermoanaerobaculia bacterium]|jgi:hypothetical protein
MIMADQRINDDNDEIDYTAEGRTPPREEQDPTNDGYDDAVRNGPSAYGVPEGEGGVFGTTGGGTADSGFQVEERPAVYDGGGDDNGRTAGVRGDDDKDQE